MLRREWNLLAAVGLIVLCVADPTYPQGNIDAGKTPAQIFSSTCTACHRRPQELKRTSASFLRQHYTIGSEEATAMASYLASIGSDPRAVEQRAKERGKAPQQQQQTQQEKAKAAAQHAQAKEPPPQAKGRKADAKAAKQPEPQPEVHDSVASVPVLEPFEE